MNQNHNPLDAAAILRDIDDRTKQAQAAFTPNAALLSYTWGFAWILGNTAVYAAFVPMAQPLIPFALGISVAAAALLGAIVFSAVHSARKVTGSRGPSAIQGAIYGNAFSIGFVIMSLLGWRLSSSGVPLQIMLFYWVAITCLIVGTLTLAGAAMWNEKSQLITGLWMCVTGLVSIAVPTPHTLLVGIGCGIGLVILAVIQSLRPSLVTGPILRAAADG